MSNRSKTAEPEIVLAAGAVLWRTPPPGAEPSVALVHRPRYDDWTLPKGKVEPGEVLAVTAAREVQEETGFRCVLGRSLGSTSYALPTSGSKSRSKSATTRIKQVEYWSAQVVDGDFAVNEEVDDLRWLSPDEARDLATYEADRDVVGRFAQNPLPTSTAVLVRHARAGSKARYKGDDDALRPLDTVGTRQAAALVPLLTAFGGTDGFSAERTRCVQTVQPWAESVGVELTMEPSLTEEGYARDPDRGRQRARQITSTSAGIPVICSQGKVIPDLMQWWADRDGVTLERTRSRKASVWVLSFVGGVLVAADYTDSPLPHLEHS
ncbi:MAG: NUDIX hydrolase [Rhodococcus sp. (in: high G+C Gram-positive bacteria)]